MINVTCLGMPLFEVVFRVKYENPLSEITKDHPSVKIFQWCNDKHDIMELIMQKQEDLLPERESESSGDDEDMESEGSSDSEDSVYSGLEDEPDTSSEEDQHSEGDGEDEGNSEQVSAGLCYFGYLE